MKKSGIIISIILIVVISIGVSVAIFFNENTKTQVALKSIASEKSDVQTKIDKLKADQDSKFYLPSDVAKYFLNEAKSNSFDRAKLYLAKSKQNEDVKKMLNLPKELSALTVEEVKYDIVTENEATVRTTIKFENADGVLSNRIFTLAKEDGAWKISEIKGES